MEVEGAFSGCFPDFADEPAADQESSLQKPLSRSAGEDDGAAKAGFECNICLGLAADPVVTACGHLYCWPCIYRWSHLEATQKSSSSLCPVCKSPFSESSLIPLYGCGLDAKSRCGNHADIPDRPKDHRKLVAPTNTISVDDRRRIYQFYGGSQGRPSAASLSPLAMLPWLSPNHRDLFTSSYQSPAVAVGRGSRESMRRRGMQELRVEIWLHQLWIFLLCCAFLCLLFF